MPKAAAEISDSKSWFRTQWDKHQEKVIAWFLANAAWLADQQFTQIIPLPGALRAKAIFFTLVLAVLAVILAALVAGCPLRQKGGSRYRWLCAGGVAAAVTLLFLFYRYFRSVERRQKEAKTPEALADDLYHFWEPLAYALIFASMAMGIVFVYALIRDWLQPDLTPPKPDPPTQPLGA